MAVFDPGDRVQIWQYQAAKIELIIGGRDPIRIPNERLTEISIINDYEKAVFPIFRIRLILEASRYYQIVETKKSVKFHICIYKKFHYNNSADMSINYLWIDDLFELILDDNDEDNLRKMKKEKARGNYQNIVESDIGRLEMIDNKIDFFLFKTDTIKGLKKNVNKILEDATVTDAIAYICGKAKIKNLLMSPVSNTKKYNPLIIPPMSRCSAIKFIDTYYGIYDTGSMIFFGLTRSYILKYTPACTAYERREIQNTSIIIPSQTSSHTVEHGVLQKVTNDNTNYIIGDNKSVSNRNDSITNDVLKGNDVRYVDSLSGTITQSISGANTIQENSVKIEVNKTENKWLGDVYTTQSAMNSIVIELRMNNIDMDLLEPNKKFNIIYEDTELMEKYSGEYVLSYVDHELMKEGNYLAIGTRAVFKRQG